MSEFARYHQTPVGSVRLTLKVSQFVKYQAAVLCVLYIFAMHIMYIHELASAITQNKKFRSKKDIYPTFFVKPRSTQTNQSWPSKKFFEMAILMSSYEVNVMPADGHK